MGNCCHRCGVRRKASKRKIVLLLVGLDNAGKTTAAKSLIGEPQDGIVPTVGFSTITLNYKHWSVTIYDVGGGQQIRGIWPQYFVDVHGIIFVVDASDVSRLEEGQNVLEQLLGHEKLSGKPMLLLANKQDCKEALDELDIVERLNVEALVNFHRCPTLVETCSALRDKSSKKKVDPAIHNGFKWLINCISKDYEQLNRRVDIDTREQKILEEQKRKERLERIRKVREERGEEAASSQANAQEDSDSDDVVTSDPFRPISEIMHGMEGGRKTVVEPALSDSRIILVKESSGEDEEKNESLTLQEQVSPTSKHGGGDCTRENVTQMVKDQLQLDALPHKKHIPLLPHRNNRTAPAPVFENVPLKDTAAIEAMFEIKKEDGILHRKEAFVEKNCSSENRNVENQHYISEVNTVKENADSRHSGALLKEVVPSMYNPTGNESTSFCVPLDLSAVDESIENMEVIKQESVSLPSSRKGIEQEKEGSTRRVVSAQVPHCNKLERSKLIFSAKSSLDESSLSSESKSVFNDSGFASPWKILPPLRPPSSGDKPRWICPTLSSIPQRPSSPGSEVVPERRDHVSSLDTSINATKNSNIFT